MEIDKNVIIINSAHDKPRSKKLFPEKEKKIYSVLKMEPRKELSLIQFSDYANLRTKSSNINKITPLTNLDEAQTVLDTIKSQANQMAVHYISIHIDSHPNTVFNLLS